jgi:hypothetical protein
MTLRAWAPAARGLPLLTVGAGLALASGPGAVAVTEGGRDLSGSLVGAAVIGGATAAFFVEDPAGETLSASPTPLGRRRALRLSAIALGLAVTLAALVAIAALRGPIAGDDLARRAAEVAAVSGLAAAVAGIGHRRNVAGAGLAGAIGGALGALLISSLAQQFHELPAVGTLPNHGRWWLVALAGWVVAAWSSRDTCRGSRRLPLRRA